MKDFRIELTNYRTQGDKLFFTFRMKARARHVDKAIFWSGAAWSRYQNGRIVEAENFLDFADLLHQLEMVPEHAVELGLLGKDYLDANFADETVGPYFRRLLWPGFQPSNLQSKILTPARSTHYAPTEDELEVLFRSTLFGMVISDTKDRIVKTNEFFESLIGWDGLDDTKRTFSGLLTGTGSLAEERAFRAITRGEIKSYKLPVSLVTSLGPTKVWVSAVSLGTSRGNLILRSIERHQLLDDIIALQEETRRNVITDLDKTVLSPMLDLWRVLEPEARLDTELRTYFAGRLRVVVSALRKLIEELDNPIVRGVELSRAWPELGRLDTSLDRVSQTCALACYRIVQYAVRCLDGRVRSLRLELTGELLRGSLEVRGVCEPEKFNSIRSICALLHGRVLVAPYNRGERTLQFELASAVPPSKPEQVNLGE